MNGLTKNEAKVMDFLVRNFKERNSIRQIGLKLGLSPRGIYKILKKLERINAIKPERIGNAIYYRINLAEEAGKKLAEFVLSQTELNNPTAKVYADYFGRLKDIVQGCILFGSVLKKGKDAKDVDVVLIMKKEDHKAVGKGLDDLRDLATKKIHDIRQTKEDLASNLKKNNNAMIDMLKYGQVLWGSELIVEAIQHGAS